MLPTFRKFKSKAAAMASLFTCSKLNMEILEHGIIHSKLTIKKPERNLLLTLNM